MQEKFIGTAPVIYPELLPEPVVDPSPRWRDHLTRSRVGKAVAGLLALGALSGASIIDAEPVHANEAHVYTIENTGGEGVFLHEQPGLHNRRDTIKIMMDGTKFTADCYLNDTPIGPRNNPAWIHGTDETGAIGFFTDVYSSSRWDANNTLHIAILAGMTTEDDKNPTTVGGHKYAHAGIQNVLFPQIRNTSLSDQVVVCNYSNIDHVRMYTLFQNYLVEPPIITPSDCPTNPQTNIQPTGWRP